MKICIDPGHSGPVEPGAVAGKITEADLNLAIALCIGEALTALAHGITLTRQGDITDTGLTCRAAVANDWAADLFLSIHCNSFSSPAACGVETYHYENSLPGQALATAIQAQLVELAYTFNRGVKSARYTVLEATDMPAILVECGFISSAKDRAILVNPEWQRKIGHAIANGVQNYFG
ncbi:MAG TPA: N-acetylmuramoyl-L-alanine amidase [Patescibacteria group bacterium]|nr:N-acetylmuramoyl-L-alanine amidase [Patescibacteria group bacterium]